VDLTDEHDASVRRPRRWMLVAAAAVAIVGVVWANVAADSDVRRRSTGSDDSVDRTEATAATVTAQQEALTTGDVKGFLATWSDDPGSQQLARRVFDNLTELGAQVRFSLARSDAQVGAVDADASWQAIVDAQWQQPQVRTRPAMNQLQYTFEPDGAEAGRVAEVSAVVGEHTAPFWLTDSLTVAHGAGWTVAASRPATARMLAAELPALMRRVDVLVPTSSDAVTVYVPSDIDAMQETSGRIAGGVERLAGVVVSADGSTGSRAPVLVVLNPDQLVTLNKLGREAVLAHEITHAITGVGVVEMPMWLAEGFADYVGVEVAGVPSRIAARAARKDVLQNGLPSEFPGNLAFGRTSFRAVEVAYQQSRLAVGAMVEAFGEPAVLRMYDRVVAHPEDLAGSVRAELGVGLAEVKRLWRAELRELADG
jgi:hypothetical protein